MKPDTDFTIGRTRRPLQMNILLFFLNRFNLYHSRLRRTVAMGFTLSFMSLCTYGNVSDGEEDLSTLTSYILGSARTNLNLELRFTDGGSDAIHQFNSGGAAMNLASLSVQIQEVEFFYEPGFFEGLVHRLMHLHRSNALLAHGEEEATGASSFVAPGSTFVLNGATATDSAGRSYQGLTLNLQVPPGNVRSVRLHITSISASGTSDASPFSSATAQLDSTVSLKCLLELSSNEDGNRPLLLNHANLFSNGHSGAAISSIASGSNFLQETECFVL